MSLLPPPTKATDTPPLTVKLKSAKFCPATTFVTVNVPGGGGVSLTPLTSIQRLQPKTLCSSAGSRTKSAATAPWLCLATKSSQSWAENPKKVGTAKSIIQSSTTSPPIFVRWPFVSFQVTTPLANVQGVWKDGRLSSFCGTFPSGSLPSLEIYSQSEGSRPQVSSPTNTRGSGPQSIMKSSGSSVCRFGKMCPVPVGPTSTVPPLVVTPHFGFWRMKYDTSSTLSSSRNDCERETASGFSRCSCGNTVPKSMASTGTFNAFSIRAVTLMMCASKAENAAAPAMTMARVPTAKPDFFSACFNLIIYFSFFTPSNLAG